jgi:hypothetical protein
MTPTQKRSREIFRNESMHCNWEIDLIKSAPRKKTDALGAHWRARARRAQHDVYAGAIVPIVPIVPMATRAGVRRRAACAGVVRRLLDAASALFLAAPARVAAPKIVPRRARRRREKSRARARESAHAARAKNVIFKSRDAR